MKVFKEFLLWLEVEVEIKNIPRSVVFWHIILLIIISSLFIYVSHYGIIIAFGSLAAIMGLLHGDGKVKRNYWILFFPPIWVLVVGVAIMFVCVVGGKWLNDSIIVKFNNWLNNN